MRLLHGADPCKNRGYRGWSWLGLWDGPQEVQLLNLNRIGFSTSVGFHLSLRKQLDKRRQDV
jgi:hypothetical protein